MKIESPAVSPEMRQTRSRRQAFLTAAIAAGIAAASAHVSFAQETRDPWGQPFTNNSIWNTPIGSSAVYVPASLGTMGELVDDHEYLFAEKPSDPLHYMYQANGSGYSVTLHVPNGFIPDPSAPGYTPNDPSAWLDVDGVSLYNLSPIQRANGTSDLTGYWYSDPSGSLTTGLYTQGIGGAHFGSLMSCLGGSIRRGEITDNWVPNRIQHAIKLELDWDNLYQNQSNSANRNQTYRWPASTSDGAAEGSSGYRGTISALKMGSLLAIPRKDSSGNAITETSLGLLTVPGKKLFHVLQDFGGYIVDTSGNHYLPNGNHAFNICFESGVETDFQSAYSTPLNTGPGSNWYTDVNKLYGMLAVVDSNTQTTVGGGGSAVWCPPAPLNLSVNPGFEQDGGAVALPVGWNEYSSNGSADYNALYTENLGTAHGGSYQLTTYRATPYYIQPYQLITNVPNGNYVLHAWVEGSFSSGASMYAWRYANTAGGTVLSANVPVTASGSGDWQQLTIPVTVTTGECEIGFIANDTAGGHWMRADDVELYPVSATIPGQIEAENYNYGGENVGDKDNDSGNNGGAYRSDDVDIEACSEGGYDVGWTAAGEWLKYSAFVTTSGNYTVTVRYAAGSNGTIHIADENGNNLTGSISLPSTGGYQTWKSVTASLPLTSGYHTLQVVEDTGGFNLNYFNFAYAPLNRASGGTASASSNPVAAEVASYAFDGNTNTKWLGTTTSASPVAWLQYQFGSGASYAVTQYKIISANDNPNRDPKSWTLAGSNDGASWTTIDTETNQSFSARFATNSYTTTNNTAYKYYRLNVTANNGNTDTSLGGTGMVQLSELQLLN